MNKIFLISCSSKKANLPAKAKYLYQSPLFKYSLKYAQSKNPHKIFILSAEYGLLNLNKNIVPYNRTLNNMSGGEIRDWSQSVLKKIRRYADLENDKFIFLAGKKYRDYLIKEMKNYEVPMGNLGIGRQLEWLKSKVGKIDNQCEKIHHLFNKMRKFKFPFDEKEIPKNGIYILFEKGEFAHGKNNRVVRVGTHNGINQLRSRLKQHFINNNKDRSIFRKNIGRAILSKNGDGFIDEWDLDLTTREAKNNHPHLVNSRKKDKIERLVSDYIQKKFIFVVFEVGDKRKRLELESEIISTISLCCGCCSSNNWLGKHSPIEKICRSGLWLVQGLNNDPLSNENMIFLKKLCG